MKRTLSTILLLTAVLLGGCTTTKPETGKYSGWMQDYSNLTEFKSPSGATSMRWISPDLKKGEYRAIMIDQVGFYPAATPGSQVSVKTLNEIPGYLAQRVRQEVGKQLTITQTPGPGVLRLRAAITSVETPTKALQAYEAVPIALIFAGVSTAAGSRDHNTVVYLEAILTDSASGTVLGKVVRKGIGAPLENSKDQLSLADTTPVLDSWAKDAAIFVSTSVK